MYWFGKSGNDTNSVAIVGSNKAMEELYALDWRTNPPEKEGWYWAKDNIYATESILVRVVETLGMPFTVCMLGIERPVTVECFSHWLGPLPVPELPK